MNISKPGYHPKLISCFTIFLLLVGINPCTFAFPYVNSPSFINTHLHNNTVKSNTVQKTKTTKKNKNSNKNKTAKKSKNSKKTAKKNKNSKNTKIAKKNKKSKNKKTAKNNKNSNKNKTAKKSKNSKKTAKKNKNSKQTTAKNVATTPTSILINPLRDLGVDKGNVCFRVKAYSNTDISEFSKPVCTYIKNSNNLELAWESGPDFIIGYQVYFGKSAKKTKNFLTDVI